jgi:hypothetical protein
MINGIPLDDFPKTLRDAILVTRGLGIQYLWIDALCILQDSPKDWSIEAGQMKNVYREAVVTISAASASKVSEGILNDRKPSPLSCQLEWRASKNKNVTTVSLRPGLQFWDGSLKSCPVSQRGWILQESLLSPRTLSYGPQQMAWECQNCQVDESGRPVGTGERYRDKQFIQDLFQQSTLRQRVLRRLMAFPLPMWSSVALKYKDGSTGRIHILPRTPSSRYMKPYDRWFDVVEEFTKRKLTFSKDTLPALAGLATAFQRLLVDQYCAGLWRGDLARGLMWTKSPPRSWLYYDLDKNPPSPNPGIPSWSWASFPGRTVHFTRMHFDDGWRVLERVRVLSIDTSATGPYPEQIALTICAPFCLVSDPSDLSAKPPDPRSRHVGAALHDQFTDLTEFGFEFRHQHRDNSPQPQRFAILRLATYLEHRPGNDLKHWEMGCSMMVVESTGGLREDEFRRVGSYRIYDDKAWQIEDLPWVWTTIRLV